MRTRVENKKTIYRNKADNIFALVDFRICFYKILLISMLYVRTTYDLHKSY